jgi:hypothetical protein
MVSFGFGLSAHVNFGEKVPNQRERERGKVERTGKILSIVLLGEGGGAMQLVPRG